MKHLVMIIQQLYSNRHFLLEEVYGTDEVFNITVDYHLHIEDICSRYFKSFQELEDYVLKLYDKEK